MQITITERRTAGDYAEEQVIEIDTSYSKLFDGAGSPEAQMSDAPEDGGGQS